MSENNKMKKTLKRFSIPIIEEEVYASLKKPVASTSSDDKEDVEKNVRPDTEDNTLNTTQRKRFEIPNMIDTSWTYGTRTTLASLGLKKDPDDLPISEEEDTLSDRNSILQTLPLDNNWSFGAKTIPVKLRCELPDALKMASIERPSLQSSLYAPVDMKTLHVVGIVVAVVAILGLTAGIIAIALVNRTEEIPPPEIIPLDWWQHCVLYQIYPRSFKDSDGDGIGDLRGIISELEHFVESGVDAIWMSPIFVSPMVDFGYDISDFYDIHYEYGTMEEFEELLDKAHDLGLKVLLDFVPNHASNESEYFVKSETNEAFHRDFFIWADGIQDPENASNVLPPSNWVSQFGGSAWEWSDLRQQFYLHQFAVQQADFNFRNREVQIEMFNIMRFWLDKGADGFRVDALPYLIEADPADHDGRYPDDPLSGMSQFESHQLGYTIPLYTKDLIELYDVVYEWREFVDRYNQDHGGDTRVLFSEGYANVSMTMLYYGNEAGDIGAHFPFNFDFITEVSSRSNARDFVYTILRWLTYMPYGRTPNWQFGNHDNNRMPTRFRHDMVDGLNSLNMMLPGVSVTYQGEEIGMRDGYVSWEDTVDVEACNRGDEDTYHLYSRDPARTPYHWNNSTNAGFSTAERTWLPIAEDYLEINLAKAKEDARSHYKVYLALTQLRKETTLSHGEYDIRALTDGTFYLVRYLRTYDTLALVFNVGNSTDTVHLDRVPHLTLPASVYISSIHSFYHVSDQITDNELTLQAGEALILRSASV